MPPKKKQAPNGFMLFTMEWKSKNGPNMSIADATAGAGKIWEKMPAQEREPYNEKAKRDKARARESTERFTCTGKAISLLEREKQDKMNRARSMEGDIESIVHKSIKADNFTTKSYFFVMVNYFTKTIKGGVYLPAEISLAEFSIKDGVCRKYHTFINPGVSIFGHHYEAQQHADTTHKLPLPPKAMGDSNLARIFKSILDFVRDRNTLEYAPLFTYNDSIPIVESVLDFLNTDMVTKKSDLRVYSIQYLFFILKEAACKLGEVDKELIPKSHYVTDAYFERDFFEHQSGIACTYHEDIDKSKYCTQSCVTHWGYTFADYLCGDMAIEMIAGRHKPEESKFEGVIVEPSETVSRGRETSDYSDTVSLVSLKSETSCATKPMSEHKLYYEKPKSTAQDDFPKVDAPRRKAPTQEVIQPMKNKRYNDNADSKSNVVDLNPWKAVNRGNSTRCVVTINANSNETSSSGCSSASGTGFGRGRFFQ